GVILAAMRAVKSEWRCKASNERAIKGDVSMKTEKILAASARLLNNSIPRYTIAWSIFEMVFIGPKQAEFTICNNFAHMARSFGTISARARTDVSGRETAARSS